MDAHEEQMEEVANVDGIIEGLRAEMNRCPATVRGYREAADIRSSLMMWQDMRERMLAHAASIAPVPA